MPVKGAELVGKNIKSFGGGFLKHANKIMGQVKDILNEEVTKNISLTCHPQEYLDIMGHPYATRHGPHGIPIHDPYWQIHTQSGRLLGAKEAGTQEASITGGTLKASAFVGLNQLSAPHAVHVIYGTSKMIPRDALGGSLAIVRPRVEGILHDNLRDFVFNFKGVG